MVDRIHRRPARIAGRTPLPGELVTVRDARAAGWTESALRHAVRLGDLDRLRRGVVGSPPVIAPGGAARIRLEAENLRAARAAALGCPRAVISHDSTAIALGIPTYGPLGRPCLTVPAGTALRELAAIHLHRATLPESDVIELNGVRLTAPARTVMDVAREHGVTAGVVAADHALREGLIDRSELATAYELCARWPGRRAARITLLSADGSAESPLESLSRLRIAALRLPAPQPQVAIGDGDGRFLGRSDFYWDEFGVVGESDGDLKYAPGDPAITAEREREQRLADAGLIVVRWGWRDLYSFDRVARRLETAFARGARPGSPERRWSILPPSPGLHPRPPLTARPGAR